ncbi:hypothetical protein MiSe_25840 [Microseira wollei NIES-4236]|uniref:Uncharacterized protein n=1 Tax=Microseira wollei NIES-4236 TaxID=2530354 RepID=A0AAV3XAU3_9CYAN|nr:hypothetical protein MiSe_25840 [Microseira wollei NIES-4236]
MRYTFVCQARSINAARLTNSAQRLYLTHLQSAVIIVNFGYPTDWKKEFKI